MGLIFSWFSVSVAVARSQYFFHSSLVHSQDEINPPFSSLFLTALPVFCYTFIICWSYAILASTTRIVQAFVGFTFLVGEMVYVIAYLFDLKSHKTLTLLTFTLPFLDTQERKSNILGTIFLLILMFFIWIPSFLPANYLTQFETNPPLFLCLKDTQFAPGVQSIASNGTILATGNFCFLSSHCLDNVRICDLHEFPFDIYMKTIAPILTFFIVILLPLSITSRHFIVKNQVTKINKARMEIQNTQQNSQLCF